MKQNKAFFLDRDGTLNVDHDFVHTRREWDWIEGVPRALKRIRDAGYLIIVITNQSGIARGYFTRRQVDELHAWVNEDLQTYGATIDAFYVAPWHPDFHQNHPPELLRERKPGTRLFEKAAETFGIDFSRSVMVGDKISDIEPALKIGIRPFLVESRFTTPELISQAGERNVPLMPSLVEVAALFCK